MVKSYYKSIESRKRRHTVTMSISLFHYFHTVEPSFTLSVVLVWSLLAFLLSLSKPVEQITDLYGKEHSRACRPTLLFQNHWHIKCRVLTSRSTKKNGPWDAYYGFSPKPQDKHDSKKCPSFHPNFPSDSWLTVKRTSKAPLQDIGLL